MTRQNGMHSIEDRLNEFFVIRAPFRLSERRRRQLADMLPWLTLAGGALLLWGAWSLWQLIAVADSWTGVASEIGVMYGTSYTVHAATHPLLWVSLGMLVVEAALLFIAYPALRARRKKGWNIVYWTVWLHIVQIIVQAFGNTRAGSLLVMAAGTVVLLYLLFQVRAQYRDSPSSLRNSSSKKQS